MAISRIEQEESGLQAANQRKNIDGELPRAKWKRR